MIGTRTAPLGTAEDAPDAAASDPARRADALRLSPLSAIADDGASAANEASSQVIAHWVRSYLMRPHVDLGRPGDVCPFTAQASRLDTIRIGLCDAGPGEATHILNVMEGAVRAFDEIPCAKSMRHFRTIIVGFPNCGGVEGSHVLKQIQNRLRPHSIFRGKMIGLFAPDSQDKGLLNPDFRPLRSPVPLLAIRMLVENDSPFVVRNPLLAPIYLLKFPRKGLRRLVAALWR